VIGFVGVAAGTAERAFFGDFERKKRTLSAKNFAPGWSEVLESHEAPRVFDAAEGVGAAREGGKAGQR